MLSEKAVYVFEEEDSEHYKINWQRFTLVLDKYQNLKELGLEWILDDCARTITFQW
jgi:hypothetical protein